MIKSIKIHRSVKFLALVFAIFGICIIQSCIDDIPVTSVVEPSTANAGDVITLKFDVLIVCGTFGPSDPTNLYVGFLAPKSWNASKGNNTVVTYTSTLGNGRFVLLDDAIKVPNNNFPGLSYPTYLKTIYGAGNNFFDDHEWVVYKSDKQYVLTSNQRIIPTITIQTKVGPQALSTKFAYFASYNGAGASQGDIDNKVYLSNNCLEVKNGTGDFIDFCIKPLASATPLAATDRDLITFDFDNDLVRTPVTGINEVYLHADAVLTDGTTISKQQSIEATHFKPVGNDEYKLVIYPPTFFGLQKTQSIKEIDYWVANKDGSKRSGIRGTDDAFRYKFPACN